MERAAISKSMNSTNNIEYTKEIIQNNLKNNFLLLLSQGAEMSYDNEFGEKEFFKAEEEYTRVLKIIKSHKQQANSRSQEYSDESHFSEIPVEISRAIACFICCGIGDALGTHVEFSKVNYKPTNSINGFKAHQAFFKPKRCSLGEFSDDTSMALCLADHILFNDFEFNPADLQIKFINWWNFSYNNCLKPRRHSFGLGSNINASMKQFIRQSREVLNKLDLSNISDKNLSELLNQNVFLDGESNTSGNGSLMRLAPVPIAFASHRELFDYGLDYAQKQSEVTHTGEEAAQACRLLAHLIMKLINYDAKNKNKNKTENFVNNRSTTTRSLNENNNNIYSSANKDNNGKSHIQIAIEECLEDFDSKNYSVYCISNSQQESQEKFESTQMYYQEVNSTPKDRNWNWKDTNFRYSPTREKSNPGYVGSYALDALAMALHISYYSMSPKQALLKAANMGGDCDTVAAIVGQIVGAANGLDPEILELYEGVFEFDEGKLAYMAYKLFTSEKKKSLKF